MSENFLRQDRQADITRALMIRWEAEGGNSFLPWWPWLKRGMHAHISEAVQTLWDKGITRGALKRFRPSVNRLGQPTKCTVQKECVSMFKNRYPPFSRPFVYVWNAGILMFQWGTDRLLH